MKKILTDIIEDENKRKPFSDEKLKNILREKGYNIARRTVAKIPRAIECTSSKIKKRIMIKIYT